MITLHASARSPRVAVIIAGIALACVLAASPPASADLFRQSLLPVPVGRVNHAPGIVELPSVLDPATASWTPPVSTDLPNPDSGLDAFTDDAGDIVIICNPSTADRRTLALAASRDGIHFPRRCDPVPRGAEGDVAHPVVIRARGTSSIPRGRRRRSGISASNDAWLRRASAISPPPKFPDPQDMKRWLAPTRWHEPWSRSRIRRFVSF